MRIDAKWVAGGLVIMSLALAAGPATAGPADDLASRKRDWESVQGRMEEVSRKLGDYLDKSKKLREMDKTELDALITQICRLDIARDDDEAERLARSLSDKMVENVRREYDSTSSAAESLEDNAERLLNDAKSLRDNTKDLASNDEVKDEASRFLVEMSERIDRFTSDVYQKLTDDYRTLTNLKEGVLKGANNPRVRAAMEYGKEKHVYNQRICEEKELSLSSGRPDCVSFVKDSCAVWEFKPDSAFSESDAADWAKKYVADVQEKFKDDPRALENCKKDADGRPIFEARGAVYPACRP
jgi:hypothetical protein